LDISANTTCLSFLANTSLQRSACEAHAPVEFERRSLDRMQSGKTEQILDT
jgi:hypothetical protein